jgi:hypothetical protein
VVTLMEEDGWPDSLANDGYNAFVNAVHLAVVKVAADFQNATHAPTPEEIQAAVDRVKAEAGSSVRTQVKGSMDGWELLWFGTFGDNDDSIGTEAFTTDSDALRNTPTINLSRRWSGDQSEDGDWELFGWFSGVVLPAISDCNLDGLFGRTAMAADVKERSFQAMRAFRDASFRDYTGLGAWWTAIQAADPELARLAAEDAKVREALQALLTEVPRLLSDPNKPVRPDDVENARLVLKQLAAASPMQSGKFVDQGLRALAEIEGRPWSEALDFMSRAKPRGRTLRKSSRRTAYGT